ncbi:MAG: trypsin-like peptidase domain-containing protein [Planctomycetales bacterium]
MNRWTVALAGSTLFLGGLVLGMRGDRWAVVAPLHAEGFEVGAPERAYRDLQTGRSALQDSSELLARISRLTTNSVVHIQSERRMRGKLVEETGSGVIVESSKAPGYYVVSNRHVVEIGDRRPGSRTPQDNIIVDKAVLDNISIHLHDGRVIHPAKIWTDPATDVAIMKVLPADLQPARWGNSDQVEIGNMVLAMGSPFGLSQSVTLGIISAKGRRSLKLGEARDMLNQDFLQTDAAINPGNSGGPLIDMQGQVIGINTAIASNSGGNEGIGFSIPSNLVRKVIDELISKGKVTRAYLGVKLDPDYNADVAARLKLDRVRGSRVVQVFPNTPAARANLQTDDVILTFDGVEVLDENHLINLVSLASVGKKVKIVVFRQGRHVTVELHLMELEDSRADASGEPGMGTHLQHLGLTLHPLEPDIAQQLGFERGSAGLLVLRVDHESPMGDDLKLYDLIEEVARTPVRTVADLETALDAASQSDSVLLTVKRRQRGTTESQVVVYQR